MILKDMNNMELTASEIINLKYSLESKPRKGWSIEDHFQAEIISILRSRGIKTVLCDMNGRNALHGQKKRLMGADKGDPDFHIILNKRVIYVEVKTYDGQQSREQKATERQIKSLGHTYFLCRGVEGVLELMSLIRGDYV